VLLAEYGKWPLTAQQNRCLGQAAEASDAFARFYAMAVLWGWGLLYGPQDNTTAALLNTTGIKNVLKTPMKNITSDFKGWLAAANEACGIPTIRMPAFQGTLNASEGLNYTAGSNRSADALRE